MFEAAFDLGGRLGPAERLGVLVPGCEPACDRGLQPAHAVEAAAPDGLTGNQGEPAFHQVEPGRPSGCEVQMETRMSGEPLLHRRVLVRPVVVADQVNLAARIAARGELRKAMNSACRWRLKQRAWTLPLATSRAANRLVVPWRV